MIKHLIRRWFWMVNLRNALWSVWSSCLTFKIMVLWDVKPCVFFLVRYKCFGGNCYLHLQDIKWFLYPEDGVNQSLWNNGISLIKLYGATSREICFFTAVKPHISYFWTCLSTFCQLLGLISSEWEADIEWSIGRPSYESVVAYFMPFP